MSDLPGTCTLLRDLRRRAGIAALSAALLPACGCTGGNHDSQSGEYPSRPIKLVVPFTAGGGTDTFARIIKKAIEDNHLLPQPLVIINVDGGGATIGSRRVKDAPPDGYTLLILHEAIVTAKHFHVAEYGPEAFEAVAGTGEVGMVIAVRDDSPYHTLRGLLDDARRRPDTLTFSANIGAATHVAGKLLEQQYPGAVFRYTPSGGGTNRFHDLKGGHVHVTGFAIEEFVRFRPAGLRGLAYFGEERHPSAPDVPTCREQGFDLTTNNMFFWWFPKGTPRDRADRVAVALQQAMQTDYVRKKLAEVHTPPTFIRGKKLAARVAEIDEKIADIEFEQTEVLPHLPAAVAAMTIAMACCVALGAARRRIRRGPPPANSVARPGVRAKLRGAACLLLCVAYVLSMQLQLASFRSSTVGFVLATGITLSGMRPRMLAALIVLAACMGFGLDYIFTQVLVVDLP